MSEIISVAAGDWNTGATWDSGTVPTAEDDVTIAHAVTVGADFTADEITVANTGSLSVASSWTQATAITGTFRLLTLDRVLNDNRRVNLDGVQIVGATPSITSTPPISTDGFPKTADIFEDHENIIIDDPGFLSSSSQMQDIKPEGIAHAYARKVSNAVRYMTLTVKIRSTKLNYLGSLYRMQQGPHQVLAVTHSCIIKGNIETVVPDASSIGREYLSVRITIAEGSGA